MNRFAKISIATTIVVTGALAATTMAAFGSGSPATPATGSTATIDTSHVEPQSQAIVDGSNTFNQERAAKAAEDPSGYAKIQADALAQNEANYDKGVSDLPEHLPVLDANHNVVGYMNRGDLYPRDAMTDPAGPYAHPELADGARVQVTDTNGKRVGYFVRGQTPPFLPLSEAR